MKGIINRFARLTVAAFIGIGLARLLAGCSGSQVISDPPATSEVLLGASVNVSLIRLGRETEVVSCVTSVIPLKLGCKAKMP